MLNIGLLVLIFIALCLIFIPDIVEAADELVLVSTPQGTAFGYSYYAAGGVDRSYSHGDQAGVQYFINASPRRWGQCSPDMGCPTGWKIKDQDWRDGWNVIRTSEPDPKVSHVILGITISKHVFKKYYSAPNYYGYTSLTSGYGSSACWQNGPNTGGCP
jgi:hypothetical protein